MVFHRMPREDVSKRHNAFCFSSKTLIVQTHELNIRRCDMPQVKKHACVRSRRHNNVRVIEIKVATDSDETPQHKIPLFLSQRATMPALTLTNYNWFYLYLTFIYFSSNIVYTLYYIVCCTTMYDFIINKLTTQVIIELSHWVSPYVKLLI
jgi:hypothetical protein